MSEPGRGFAFPEYDQAVAFYNALMERLGIEPEADLDEARLRASLDRARHLAEQQRGDILTLGASLLFGLIRDQAFGKRSAQAGTALALAFLLRHGVVLVAEDDEIAGVSRGIAEGQVFMGMLDMWLRESARAFR